MPQLHAGILTLRVSKENVQSVKAVSCELKLSCDMLRAGTQASPSLQGPFMLEIEAILAGE